MGSLLLEGPVHSITESRLYESDEWFTDGRKRFVDLGIGKRARGVAGLGVVGGYTPTVGIFIIRTVECRAKDLGFGSAGKRLAPTGEYTGSSISGLGNVREG
jgi:hypothetical protein